MHEPQSVSATRNLEILNHGRASVAATAAALVEMERERGLSLIVRTTGEATPEQIETAIREAHGLRVTVEPVFARVDPAADVNDMERFFLLTLPGLSQADLRGNVFDIAYQLRDRTAGVELASVEPDILDGIYAGAPDPNDHDVRVRGSLCNVSDKGPDDHGWHLRRMRVPEAWQLPLGQGGKRFGEGIVVAHPDTGWAEHAELDREALDLERSWDFYDGDPKARDPLWSDDLVAALSDLAVEGADVRSPGHGTGTASVIVSRGPLGREQEEGADQLTGVAPRATLVPLRVVRFVVFEDAAPVARAIEHAANHACHVISMSLGGLGTKALEAAVNYAVAQDLIVCAAAGNCLAWPGSAGMISPGNYPNCIGVGGTNQFDRPWPFSSRGPTVDVSAPAENVWRACFDRDNRSTSLVAAGQGTSFAVAGVAGVAALWLAHHGRENLRERYRGRAFLHHVFHHLLQQTARRPGNWWPGDQLGPGIVDAAALLAAALPDPDLPDLRGSPERLRLTPQRDLVVGMFPGATQPEVGELLAALLAPGAGAGSPEADAASERWGPELIRILVEHRAASLLFAALLATAREADETATEQARALVIDELVRWASGALREVLRASLP